MQYLSVDNAWPHQTHSLENLIRELCEGDKYRKITLVWRPPYMARYGALIERFFGSLSARLKDRFAGVGAIVNKDIASVQKAAEEACLLYEDIYKLVIELIVTYHNTPHRELGGMTPQQKWLQGLGLNEPHDMLRLIKTIPENTLENSRRFLRRYPEDRLLDNQGFNLWACRFTSPELEKYPRKDKKNDPIPYNLRYDEDDVSIISLFRDEDWLCDLYNVDLLQPDGSLVSMSLWELQMKKRVVLNK